MPLLIRRRKPSHPQQDTGSAAWCSWSGQGRVSWPWGSSPGIATYRSKKDTLIVVYIPTVPNPTSGNLAFVSEREVIETDMSVEDAMKVVFSGGIVLPDTMGTNLTTRRGLSESLESEERVPSP